MILGFILLATLVLGAALCVLAALLLGAALGAQLLIAVLLQAGAGPLISAVASLTLLAGAAFAFGLLLALIGLASLLFPQVRAFLQGLWLLLKMAMNGPVIAGLPAMLDLAADALEAGGFVLAGPLPAQAKSASAILSDAGDGLISAGGNIPTIPRVDTEPLWLVTSNNGTQRVEGYVPQPPLAPGGMHFVTGGTLSTRDTTPLANALSGAGGLVKNAGAAAGTTGQALKDTAGLMRSVANLIRQATQ